MNSESILKDAIIKVSTKHVDISTINDDTSIIQDLGFTSVQIIQLLIEIEERFGILIDDDDLELDQITIYKNLYSIIAEALKE